MISNLYKGKVILDTVAQFQQLVSQGTLTIEGRTITYDPYHYDYWVKESAYYTKSEIDGMVQIIRGTRAPSANTIATLGQCYIDITNDKIYQCVDKTWRPDNNNYDYVWIEIINDNTVALHCATSQDINNLFS